jgi:two-component system chemotaxis sensor kinase CheA
LDDAILTEFLVDSHEGLDQLDRDFVALEQDPASRDALASAFRALHTIKGTCSFFGFRRLERVAHAGESVLASLRAGKLALTPGITGALLAVVDTVRRILAGIESDRREPEGDDTALLERVAAWLPAAARTRTPAPPPAGAPAPAAGQPASALQQQHVRVDVRRLDQIMDLVGELVLARNQLLQSVPAGSGSAAGRASQRLDQVTTRLQDEVMRARMQPVSALWARLPRLARDVASACGKSVRLEMEGNSTELDRTLVEALKDPLTHLVRNAIDHGIEPPAARARVGKPAEGVLALRARQEDGSVHLLISDDGAGMSLERIREQAIARGLVDRGAGEALTDHDWLQFVFLPGFSTAAKVTSISGRGVGLDAARAAIESVGGTIEVSTTAGSGTTFHLRLPLTLAIIPALTVEQSGECFAIPQAHVLELVRLGSGASIERAHDREVFRLRGELLPVTRLERVLGDGHARAAQSETAESACDVLRHLVVLSAEGRRFGLGVTRARDTEEIVVKPLGERLREGGLFAGATVRGDGRVALILDVRALAEHAGVGRTGPAARPERGAAAPERVAHVPLLLVRARSGQAAAVRVCEVDRIIELEPAAFERFGADAALRFEGEALPVTTLEGDPPLEGPATFAGERTWPVLLHWHGGRRQGLVVDVVEDIVDWPGPSSPGRVVIRDRVTDLFSLAASAPGDERRAA